MLNSQHARRTPCEHTCSGVLEGTLQGTYSRSPGPSHSHKPGHQKQSAGLGRVSTRQLSYLFDEPGGEYERFPICPPDESPTIHMYVWAGVLVSAQDPPRVRGSGRTNVLALRVGIFQYNNVLVPTVRRVARMRRHLP
jgi:hypothetical protein